MSAITDDADVRLRHLLAVVERNRDERCQALREAARTQTRQLVSTARREARTRLHRKVLETREQARQQLTATEARERTRLRLQRHDADRILLARAWPLLGDELHRRWQSEKSRRQWVEGLVDQAATVLTGPHWRIEHPADWPAAERHELEARLAGEESLTAVFQAYPEITAGLRICAGTACIDGTIAGLLRERTRVEALLLATLNECRSLLSGDSRDGHDV